MLGPSTLVARVRSLWRGVRRGPALHTEMDEEFRLHQELRAADLVRAGLAPAEAARRARLEFGSTEMHKDAGRQARGLRPFDALHVSWLDVKLGFRMLVKYPGLTVVGGMAIAFAIALGAGTFEFVRQFVHPTLPLPDGDRIVALRNWDVAASRAEPHALHDFVTWREELRSVRELGAYRTAERNLITGEGRGEPEEVAEISASAFRLVRIAPLLGRPLIAADEQPGAPPVAVIGYALWQRRFGGDPAVLGRVVRIGRTPTTVVGVMPEGFAFPLFHHLWVPLRLSALEFARGDGPAIGVFGRLAPGATLDEARAELATLGARATAAFPRTHEHLRPQVLPYARSYLDLSAWELAGVMSGNLVLVLLLVLVYGNVALLLFARAASRESELVVRSALGASRGRLVTQLFAEALVLGGVAAVVGLAAAALTLRWGMGVLPMLEEELPFWFSDRLSLATVLYAGALTLLGAVIAGVGPALRATRGLGARLKQASAAGGGLRFGGVWTAVIVTQVAVTVAVPLHAYVIRGESGQLRSFDPGVPAREYLSARLEMDRELPSIASADTSQAAFAGRFAATYRELARRLEADPAVLGVTFADNLPGMIHPWRRVEVEGGAPVVPDSVLGLRASRAAVDVAYFDVLGAPILAGRAFHTGDLAPDRHVVIANQSFVHDVLGGRNPIGQRVRYVELDMRRDVRSADAEPGPWYEIVGVVPDLGMTGSGGRGTSVAGLYHPLAPGAAGAVHLAVHVRGRPALFAPRLRTLATAVDPTLRLYQVAPLDEIYTGVLGWLRFLFWLTVLGISLAVVLSLAGIYAVLAFTVARRTREIGIRVALGADRRRVIMAIFRRPLTQVALGVAVGTGLAGMMVLVGTGVGTAPSLRGAALLAAYAVLMLGVCLLACIVPTRRALRVEPTEALRADG